MLFVERKPIPDGEPCEHLGCLRHVSHPCEGCGRIAGYKLPELPEMWRQYFAQLEEIKAAAQIIFEVSDKASFKATSIECPHGNIPSYPAHAWWCDECFFRLKNALEGKS